MIQEQLKLDVFETTKKCDRCGKETDFLVDYFEMLCQDCKNETSKNT